MICPGCKRQVSRKDPFCGVCGRPLGDGAGQRSLELVLPDGARVPLSGVMAIGRGDDSTIHLDDRSVSRRHARIIAGGGVPLVEDVGSSYGTFLDGRRIQAPAALSDGSRLSLGDVELRVERPRATEEAGRTLVVPAGGTVMVSAAGAASLDAPGTQFGFRPRARSGYSLKRLEAGEGERRVVLRNERTGEVLRMGDDEAALFELLDGSMALPDLMVAAEQRFGLAGIARLTRLLSELGERGFLADVEARDKGPARGGLFARLSRSRQKTFPGAGRFFERVYMRGGYVLFTRAGLLLLAIVGVAGITAFVGLIAARYGTPFVVARKVGLGGLAFLLGRFVVVAIHELAHGLAMASFGRKPSHAGVKLVFLFPFAFVDTSDAWFEPKRRRLAISGAGPASDFVVGGIFSIVALALGGGTLRDIFFQLAFAAYVGAFFNLNPLLDRDGYHMLVDWLQQPGLRLRAREHIMRRLAGRPVRADAPRSLTIYGALTLAWMVAAVGFVVIMTILFHNRMAAIAPEEVVWSVLGAFYLLLFVPVALVIGRPLWERVRMRRKAVPYAA
jgi:putative peptide zinc metalloprotease protein